MWLEDEASSACTHSRDQIKMSTFPSDRLGCNAGQGHGRHGGTGSENEIVAAAKSNGRSSGTGGPYVFGALYSAVHWTRRRQGNVLHWLSVMEHLTRLTSCAIKHCAGQNTIAPACSASRSSRRLINKSELAPGKLRAVECPKLRSRRRWAGVGDSRKADAESINQPRTMSGLPSTHECYEDEARG